MKIFKFITICLLLLGVLIYPQYSFASTYTSSGFNDARDCKAPCSSTVSANSSAALHAQTATEFTLTHDATLKRLRWIGHAYSSGDPDSFTIRIYRAENGKPAKTVYLYETGTNFTNSPCHNPNQPRHYYKFCRSYSTAITPVFILQKDVSYFLSIQANSTNSTWEWATDNNSLKKNRFYLDDRFAGQWQQTIGRDEGYQLIFANE